MPGICLDKGGISLFKRTAMLQSTLLLSAVHLIMQGISMLFQAYLTGQIGAAGLGLMQLVFTVHGFALTLGTSGIRVAAMYLSAEEYGLGRPQGVRQAMLWCLGTGCALSALVGCTMATVADTLALIWVKDLRTAPALRLLGMTLPVSCIHGILSGYFTACGKIRQLVTAELLDRIAGFFLTIKLLSMGQSGDLSHACISVVGGDLLACAGSSAVLLGWMLRDFRALPAGEHSGMGRRLRNFCVPVALNDYLRSGLGSLKQFLIPYGLSQARQSRSAALADYGTIHGMVFPVLTLPMTILFSLTDLLIPRFAKLQARSQQHSIAHIAQKALHSCVLFAFGWTGLLLVISRVLGQLLYNSSQAGHYLKLFAPLIPMLYLDCIVDGMHKGLGQQIYCVRVNSFTNLLDVVLLFFLLPRFGMNGYLFTYAVTHAINFCLSLRKLLQLTELQPDWLFLLKAAFSLFGAAACAALLPMTAQWRCVIFSSSFFLLVFVLLLWATGALDVRRSAQKEAGKPLDPVL